MKTRPLNFNVILTGLRFCLPFNILCCSQQGHENWFLQFQCKFYRLCGLRIMFCGLPFFFGLMFCGLNTLKRENYVFVMPIDHKRISGPEDPLPYNLFSKLYVQNSSRTVLEIPKTGERHDGRLSLEHRKIFAKTGIVTQAKGSAYVEVGNSKVIVSVFDPREIPNRQDYSLKGELHCEFKYAPFSCKKRRPHQQDTEEKIFSVIMKQALESTVCRHEFPNFQVDIYALILQNDGSCLSAAITAAGIALSHAGVPTYDLITSVTLGVVDDSLFLDPTAVEEIRSLFPMIHKKNIDHGLLIITLLHTQNQILQIYHSGNFSLEKLVNACKILENACGNLIPVVQKCLIKHVTKSLQNYK